MEKTIFAGLTVLGPTESIYADNAAFITRDRVEIDRALRIGVKTHRHDGSAGLADPLVAPSGLVIGSGGTIPAGLSLSLGITFEDAYGGETLLGPTTLVVTPAPLQTPTNALSGVAEYTSGSLDVDSFSYAITYSDGEGGETPIGPAILVTRDPGFTNAKIVLGNLNVGMAEAGAVGWRLYRARSGGEYVLLATGTGASFTDDGTVPAQCDVHPPNFNLNSTGGSNQAKVTLPNPGALDGLQWINLYCSQSGSFDEGCLVGQYPVGSGGGSVFVPNLSLLDAQPPDVNRSYGGATQIDPDTELIDWHWKRPVATFGDLPTGVEGSEEGDVRVVTGTGTAYIYVEGAWKEWAGGGGGGALDVFAFGASPGSGATPFTLTDPFSGEALNANWLTPVEKTDPSGGFTVAGGLLTNSTGGSPMARFDRVTVNGKGIIKFNKDESGFVEAGIVLKTGEGRYLYCTYADFAGLEIGTDGEGGSNSLKGELFETRFVAAAKTDYWLVAELEAGVVTVSIWTTDPELGGSASKTLSYELDAGEAEELKFITSEGSPGLVLVGAPGSFAYEWSFTGDGAPTGPSADYVVGAESIEFVGGPTTEVDVARSGSGAVVTVDAMAPDVLLPGGTPPEPAVHIAMYGPFPSPLDSHWKLLDGTPSDFVLSGGKEGVAYHSESNNPGMTRTDVLVDTGVGKMQVRKNSAVPISPALALKVPGKELYLQMGLIDGTGLLVGIGGEVEEDLEVNAEITELPTGDWWLTASKDGAGLIVVKIWDHDPAEGGSPDFTVEYTLDPEDATQKQFLDTCEAGFVFINEVEFGGLGWVDSWGFTGDREAVAAVDYVQNPEFIEFAEGEELEITPVGGGVKITMPKK